MCKSHSPGRHPFLPKTQGSFYYHTSEPPISGQVRFRITQDDDSSSFASGVNFGKQEVPFLPWCIIFVSAETPTNSGLTLKDQVMLCRDPLCLALPRST
ncbi:hypothetical protein K443DRAFT_680129 [Laccaria amethystina LaAM-08-1]|uniref:Uncharacterized protein n=1 Tax=Laccaria amethystina LaAM-08-1 TaxID=1095629 RepID=A0A0C9WNK8_9AGAR|nr:hypothetical protein K443DRAFT_680129 [Laccaria amethystina LaAM-08-1]